MEARKNETRSDLEIGAAIKVVAGVFLEILVREVEKALERSSEVDSENCEKMEYQDEYVDEKMDYTDEYTDDKMDWE